MSSMPSGAERGDQAQAMAEFDNKTCARLEVWEELHDSTAKKTLFVISVWEQTSFSLAVSNGGHQAWTFEGCEAFVKARADVWDKNVSWVMEKLKFCLSVGQPGVTYHFSTTRDNQKKLSFEIQDKDLNLSLTANLLMLNASSESVTSDMLGFLLHGNETLTVEYLKKCRSFDQTQEINQALVEKIEHLKNEMFLFQQDIFLKFDRVVNSKKAKLREFRERLKRIEQCKARGKTQKNDTTSDDDNDEEEESDDQPWLPEKCTKRGEESGEMEYSKEDGNRNHAVGALVVETPYPGLQRKRRRN